jgi:UDP-N-acetyl-D-mannosaminuronic acid transferase (WecB/TagA/CpsF family)
MEHAVRSMVTLDWPYRIFAQPNTWKALVVVFVAIVIFFTVFVGGATQFPKF